MLNITLSLRIVILLFSILHFSLQVLDSAVILESVKLPQASTWQDAVYFAFPQNHDPRRTHFYAVNSIKTGRARLPVWHYPIGFTATFLHAIQGLHFNRAFIFEQSQSCRNRNGYSFLPFLNGFPPTKLSSVKRPIYRLQQNGSISTEETMPRLDQVFEGWDDIIEEERTSWKKTNNSEEKVVQRFRKLTKAEEFNKRLMEMRHFTQEDEEFRAPKFLPRLWIVRPKLGAYCKLMTGDLPQLKSLVSSIRSKYTANELEIVNVTMDVRMPLCEVFFSGPIPEEIRIFYARGGTLQADCAPRFWTECPLLHENSPLYYKYGGNYCPGLFPQWDAQGILEELDDCMNQPPTHAMSYPLNWSWNNPGALTPENEQEREWWYHTVHWPTRQAVQSAFENGIEDFREVIAMESEQLEKRLKKRSIPKN
ncbi:hypothetical protein IE077_001379 [Cardiosporidium cionae]|uniref:Uncharacterized protein n=1 Tax=Cardiosporidium cionae TaxID=476202 RepID=A0ABQ7JDC7_9APIC|nr:hypothetical protein IE077_001379 [Cardiosporidium cionae]|eukprot:KAF8821910.1 hypothetical protein IE077_001379 [Cardiosporidium cionae]